MNTVLVIKLIILLASLGIAGFYYGIFRQKNWQRGLVLAGIGVGIFLLGFFQVELNLLSLRILFFLVEVGSLYFLRKKQYFFAVVGGVLGGLFQPQGIIILLFLLWYLIRKWGWRQTFKAFGVAVPLGVVVLLLLSNGSPPNWLREVYRGVVNSEVWASYNAGSFLAVLDGNNISADTPLGGGVTYQLIGIIGLLVSLVYISFFYGKKPNLARLPLVYGFLSWAVFLFIPGAQGIDLLPTFCFLLLASGFWREGSFVAAVVLVGFSCLLGIGSLEVETEALERLVYLLGITNTLLFGFFVLFLYLKSGWLERKSRKYFQDYGIKLRQVITEKLVQKPFALKQADYGRVGLLLVFYLIFVFGRLGTTATPQKGIEFTSPQEGIEITFTEKVELSYLLLYDGAGTGRLKIQSLSFLNVWRDVFRVKCDDFYVLKRLPFALKGVTKLRLIPDFASGQIHEIGFLNKTGQLVQVKTIHRLMDQHQLSPADYPLFDEQERLLQAPSYFNSTYFDEIYHGRTALEFVKGDPVYETTHPPLGKDLLSLGILLLGKNPLGMRFMNALFGVILMGILFFFGREVLKTRFAAYTVMLMGILDFMPFVQSRYSTIDTMSVTFITLMVFFAFRYLRHLFSGANSLRAGILIGCFACAAAAISVKWTGVYGFAGVVALILFAKIRQLYLWGRDQEFFTKNCKWFVLKNTFFFFVKSAGLFLLVAPVIYYLTYLPFFNCEGVAPFTVESLQQVVESQKHMYSYHANLKASHPFASAWWSWPFNFKPLWLYAGEVGEWKMTIVSLGNPVIWLIALVGVFVTGYQLWRLPKLTGLHLVVISFLAQYLPWVLVSRVAFIYHFYPCLPLFYFFGTVFLEAFWRLGSRGKKLVYSCWIGAAVLLVIYYPVLSGLPVPDWYINGLRLFSKDWVF